MRNRMPSMMSLSAFEAAGRHLSFTRVAIELNLTKTAISHQIKNLEDLLHVKLFVRSANMIALTEVGETRLRSVRHRRLPFGRKGWARSFDAPTGRQRGRRRTLPQTNLARSAWVGPTIRRCVDGTG